MYLKNTLQGKTIPIQTY